MKISVVTVVYNGEAYIESCIQSVLSQNYQDLEYIVIDGGSKDNTMKIVDQYRDRIDVVVSEPDKGIYDAMNKGLKRATGDAVGTLNADDFYSAPNVISRVAELFESKGVDCVYGDLVYVKPEDTNKVVRYYSAKGFRVPHLLQGDMPPHPTFFAKTDLFKQHGYFKPHFKIAGDYELMLRLLYLHKASFAHNPMVMVKMRTGGVSTAGIKSTLKLNQEILQACRSNGVKTNLVRIYSKYFRKIFQLIRRPSRD